MEEGATDLEWQQRNTKTSLTWSLGLGGVDPPQALGSTCGDLGLEDVVLQAPRPPHLRRHGSRHLHGRIGRGLGGLPQHRAQGAQVRAQAVLHRARHYPKGSESCAEEFLPCF